MKKQTKILAGAAAFLLVGFVACFANGLVGNPLSKWLAGRAAQKYLETHYAGQSLKIETVSFDFKMGNYNAHVQSPTSIDTHFSLYLNTWGKVTGDLYENVTSGWNTMQRLDEAYRKQTDEVFQSPEFPYKSDIDYGTLEIREHRQQENGRRIYGLEPQKLPLDMPYDGQKLGAEAGHLVFYVEQEELTAENTAKILRILKRQFDQHGVPFYAVDLILEKPKQEKQNPGEERDYGVEDFLYQEIESEELSDKVAEAAAARRAYYDAMDQKKEAELPQER